MYTPRVVAGEECRRSACVSLVVPTFWNHVAHVRRNARKFTDVFGSTHCLPFGQSFGFLAMMPARMAAGQMWRRRKFFVRMGVLFFEGKIRSVEFVACHFTSSSLIDNGSQRRRGRHPALGGVTLSELVATWAVHDLTHLHQVSRIMAHQYRAAVGPWSAYLGVLHCDGHSS